MGIMMHLAVSELLLAADDLRLTMVSFLDNAQFASERI
jgi:hypothetical protein